METPQVEAATTAEKLNEMAEVVAAARTTTTNHTAPEASQREGTVEEEESITARIDSVDPAARIAQLDKLKADMERNFMAMKRVYGGGGAKKAAAVAPVVQE